MEQRVFFVLKKMAAAYNLIFKTFSVLFLKSATSMFNVHNIINKLDLVDLK